MRFSSKFSGSGSLGDSYRLVFREKADLPGSWALRAEARRRRTPWGRVADRRGLGGQSRVAPGGVGRGGAAPAFPLRPPFPLTPPAPPNSSPLKAPEPGVVRAQAELLAEGGGRERQGWRKISEAPDAQAERHAKCSGFQAGSRVRQLSWGLGEQESIGRRCPWLCQGLCAPADSEGGGGEGLPFITYLSQRLALG